MARKTFFSFHYERDAWRAGQVRNSDLLPTADEFGFIDAVDWESIKRQGDEAIKRWIGDQLRDTSVTVVLIGAETAGRPWVRHEVVQSWNRGNGLVGVRIHNIKNHESETDVSGRNPFDLFKLPDGTVVSSVCNTYDWVLNDGRNNLGRWCEEAVAQRKRYGVGDEIVLAVEAPRRTEGVGAIPVISASAAFVPHAPWCADYAKKA